MIDPVTMNARKPEETEYGTAMLNRMNERHLPLYEWGLSHINIMKYGKILDIGFGGGQNIKNICRLNPQAMLSGIDYSEASFKKCSEINADAIKEGRVKLSIGSAAELPYGNDSFELATAFETVYYWPDIDKCFENVYRVLKKNGIFLICNEDSSESGNEEIAEALNMNFYGEGDFKELLGKAGFENVCTYTHNDGKWICAVGKK